MRKKERKLEKEEKEAKKKRPQRAPSFEKEKCVCPLWWFGLFVSVSAAEPSTAFLRGGTRVLWMSCRDPRVWRLIQTGWWAAKAPTRAWCCGVLSWQVSGRVHAGDETIMQHLQHTLGRTMRVVWFGRSGRDTTPPMSALLLLCTSPWPSHQVRCRCSSCTQCHIRPCTSWSSFVSQQSSSCRRILETVTRPWVSFACCSMFLYSTSPRWNLRARVTVAVLSARGVQTSWNRSPGWSCPLRQASACRRSLFLQLSHA